MKLKQVLLGHKFHQLSRSFCFQKLNPNIFQCKFDFSCSTAVSPQATRKKSLNLEKWSGFTFEKAQQSAPGDLLHAGPSRFFRCGLPSARHQYWPSTERSWFQRRK